MTLRVVRSFQALLMALLGLYLLSRVWNGSILLYINQRFVILAFFAGLCMIILAQVLYKGRHSALGDHENRGENAPTSLWWVMVPIVIGFLIPPRPLSPSAVNNRGMMIDAPLSARIEDTSQILELSPTERTVLDWIRLFSYSEDVTPYIGQPADVTGFVFYDGRLNSNQFMVGRFTITCCVADATALGIIVQYPEAAVLKEHSWVRVTGTVDIFERDGRQYPIIIAETVQPVPQPEQPYLFP
ncbi:MAG: TIGR03943 family protein [Chloroflexota bacterium]